MALSHSVVGELARGRRPSTRSMKPIVSRISESRRDPALEVGAGEQLLEAAAPRRSSRRCRRCRSGRSATARGSRGRGPTAGSAAARSGWRARWGSWPCRASGSSRGSIIRAAIQSVSIIMSRSIGSQAPSWLRTLRVELGVVVDVVGVVDRDAGPVLEADWRRCRLGLLPRVDVGRPVGDDQRLVLGRQVGAPCTTRRSCLAPSTLEERQLQRGEAEAGERDGTAAPEQACDRRRARSDGRASPAACRSSRAGPDATIGSCHARGP